MSIAARCLVRRQLAVEPGDLDVEQLAPELGRLLALGAPGRLQAGIGERGLQRLLGAAHLRPPWPPRSSGPCRTRPAARRRRARGRRPCARTTAGSPARPDHRCSLPPPCRAMGSPRSPESGCNLKRFAGLGNGRAGPARDVPPTRCAPPRLRLTPRPAPRPRVSARTASRAPTMISPAPARVAQDGTSPNDDQAQNDGPDEGGVLHRTQAAGVGAAVGPGQGHMAQRAEQADQRRTRAASSPSAPPRQRRRRAARSGRRTRSAAARWWRSGRGPRAPSG